MEMIYGMVYYGDDIRNGIYILPLGPSRPKHSFLSIASDIECTAI